MNRDKQIEEMAKLLCSTCYETNEEDCKKFEGVCGICDATRLYNAGYRKSSEVAEEIFGEIERMVCRMHNLALFGFSIDTSRELAELKKKYTKD